MTTPRPTVTGDAMASDDPKTKEWKVRFACAQGAYDRGMISECESLLFRLMEKGKTLQESKFATNTSHVGLGAVYTATGKIDKAVTFGIILQTGTREAATIRFYAQLHIAGIVVTLTRPRILSTAVTVRCTPQAYLQRLNRFSLISPESAAEVARKGLLLGNSLLTVFVQNNSQALAK